MAVVVAAYNEVPEADLSMELAGQLKRSLTDLEEDFSKEVMRLCAAAEDSLSTKQLSEGIQEIHDRFADVAVTEMVCLLQSFNPEISKEKVSSDIHSILHTDAIVGHLEPQMIAALREYVPLDTRSWLGRDIERHLYVKKTRRHAIWRKALAGAAQALEVLADVADIARETAKDGKVQAAAAGATGGAAVAGVSGGAFGLVAGSTFGATCGLLPAFVTFGLSIPIGAMVGGGAGLIAGASAGGTAGLVGGGFAGHHVYVKRDDIRSGASEAWAKVHSLAGTVKERANSSASYVKDRIVGGTGGTA
eukprot:CAMPEP_0115080462 /NCGR_PEP_ID=MMETSP0227-20121206/18692_1 /TAXON_ID=89957 /ORGANISM="Polarella glacialis, Strain CCMP 1383" /LENGTH=304 /DNA_ID=CAMNT_0002468109 /DNA_START=45 /DNA_END=959 /DNA_ORIENTATION=+